LEIIRCILLRSTRIVRMDETEANLIFMGRYWMG
jgi:hypothetical protein